MRPRLVDVAELAGTSKPIASRALNRDPTLAIGSELRERIRSAAETLGYQPHAAARSLRRSAAGAIGLLIPDLTNPAYALIIRGAFTRAAERGFVVLLLEDRNGQGVDVAVAELVLAVRIDALIVASAFPGHPLFPVLDELAIPHVFGNRAVAGSSRNVTLDDAVASALAVDYLADLGHRSVAHISGPLDLDPALRRATGFSERAAERGLQAISVEAPGFLEHGGADAAARLLEQHPEVTGVYTSSVSQAAGLLHVAGRLGIEVPDDLSVVAYADTPLADVLMPALSAVSMPFAELGAACVDAVIAQGEGREPQDIVVETAPSIVARSSAGPPRVRVARG
ncbi:MAG TPA: LacI family DNA-binding transcriptional regulator [Gaiellales bacterium]